MRVSTKRKIALILSGTVLAGTAIYAVAFNDFAFPLFMLPFFVLGCAHGKPPVVLLALSVLPALVLLAASTIKFALIGVPLVTYDHYFLRRNLVMLAYNDWRIALGLFLAAAAVVWYLRTLLSGKGALTHFEKVSLPVLAGCAAFQASETAFTASASIGAFLRPYCARAARSTAARSVAFGRSTKNNSSNLPLRSNAAGSAETSFAVATTKTDPARS